MSGTWADAGLRVAWTNFPDFGGIGDVLRADAKAYWKMEEASGTRADATGRGNDLTQFNTLDNAAGKVGNAAHFVNGLISSTGYLRREHTDDLSYYGRDLYTAFWVRFNQLNHPSRLVAKWDALDVEEYAVELYEDSGNPGLFQLIISAGNNGFGVEPTAISVDTWYFVEAYTRSVQDDCAIALNGGAFTTAAMDGQTESTVQFSIGVLTGAPIAVVCAADIDEVGIWHRILTADERAYLYNGGTGRTLYP